MDDYLPSVKPLSYYQPSYDTVHAIRQRNKDIRTHKLSVFDVHYFVIVTNCGYKTRTTEIIQKFQENVSFAPINLIRHEAGIAFTITSEEVAFRLEGLSNCFTDPCSFKPYLITVTKVPPNKQRFFRKLGESELWFINQFCNTNYDHENKTLDLSNFNHSQEKDESKAHLTLNDPSVLVALTNHISTYCNDVQVLSIKSNHLTSLRYINYLVYSCPNVKVLDLSNNFIRKDEDFQFIQEWNLTELFIGSAFSADNIVGNDKRYFNLTKMFPTLKNIHSKSIALFSKGNTFDHYFSNLAVNKTHCVHKKTERVIMDWLIQFFALYDGDSPMQTRKGLAPFYMPHATFSFSMAAIMDGRAEQLAHGRDFKEEILNTDYQAKFRKIRDDKPNGKILTTGSKWCGNLEVIKAISMMKKTEHGSEEFIRTNIFLDVWYEQYPFLGFSVIGSLCDDLDANDNHKLWNNIHCFKRSFFCKCLGTESYVPFKIVSDLLVIFPTDSIGYELVKKNRVRANESCEALKTVDEFDNLSLLGF